MALDILYTYAEDSGTYMCKASNKLGEAVNTALVSVQSRKNIYLEPHNPDALEKIRELEAQGHPARLEVEEPIEIPPTLTPLRGTTEVPEGKRISVHSWITRNPSVVKRHRRHGRE